ncbi:MAG: TolC family protein [Deltaproteobacteria bacterium]|nr:TolC family protein [Deltaproteobacteria bacterium]
MPFFLFLLLFSFPAWGAPRPIFCHLKQCTEIALRNNQQIHAADAEMEMSRGKLDEAHPGPMPFLKYESRLAPVPRDIDNAAASFFRADWSVFNSLKLELGAPISTFGRLTIAQDLAELGIDASWFKRQKTSDEIVFRVHQVYHGILLARQLQNLADQAVEALEGKIEEQKKERVVDQIGVLKIKVALFEVRRKVEEAKKKEMLALAVLKVQMGLEQDVPLSIPDEDLTPVSFTLRPLSYYLTEAHDYLPEFKLLAVGVAAKGRQLSLEKKAPFPVLGWGGFFDIGHAPAIRGEDGESSFSNPFNYTKVGVGFQLKGEFDYRKMRAKVRQARADLQKVSFERGAATRGLELDVEKSYWDVVEAARLMEQSGDEKKTARQMVFLTKSNLDIGIGEKKDYYDGLQSYLVFQGRELEAIFNYNVAVSELKKKTGRLYAGQKEIP